MLRLGMFICALFFAFQSFASTEEGVVPVLRFDKSVEAREVDSPYLVFVPEDVSFPSGPQKAKFEKALEIMEEVMNSEEFKQKVLSYVRSNGERGYMKNYLWNDSKNRLSNEDIYHIIMTGDEKMRSGTVGEMNINSWVKKCSWFESMGTWCRKVIGSTDPGSSKWIKQNWKFYKNYEPHQMVSNMVHEWLHLLGFLHGNTNIKEEVPYVVGYIAGEVAKDILARQSR